MAALTAARKTDERSGAFREPPVKDGVTIHQGALVCMQAGVAIPGKVADDLAAIGRAERTVTGDGAKTIPVTRGIFQFANDGADAVTLSHVGADCYVLDDQTVSSSHDTNARSVAGKVYDVDADGVWVEFK